MSKKGYSPDNSACEGFFGRLKNEMFYQRDWKNTTINQFINKLDDYIHWYNNQRIKLIFRKGLRPFFNIGRSKDIFVKKVQKNIRTPFFL